MGDRTTYDGTIEELTAIVDLCAASGDRAGYFAAMYLAVTTTVRERAGEGRFENPARMERFVTSFAGRYLDAEAAWRARRPCTVSWQAAFDATRRWPPIILQHLLLGMNAHINLDLGVVAAALDPDAGIEAIRGDFNAINDVLAELVDGCQQALNEVSPWLDLADRVGGSHDETMIRFSLVVARDQAWSAATRLSSLSGDALATEIAAIDRATAGVAYVVEHPGFAASVALAVVRARECAKPAEVMRLLAAVRPG